MRDLETDPELPARHALHWQVTASMPQHVRVNFHIEGSALGWGQGLGGHVTNPKRFIRNVQRPAAVRHEEAVTREYLGGGGRHGTRVGLFQPEMLCGSKFPFELARERGVVAGPKVEFSIDANIA